MIIKKILKKIFAIINLRINCWYLFIGKGSDPLNMNLFKTVAIKPPKNKFWADPFLINFKKKKYLFFEEFSYKEKKGLIKCGEISNNKLFNVKTVLEGKYHLSYPCVNKINGIYYLIPECSESNELSIYKSVKFPYSWELYRKIFTNKKVADPTIFQDKYDQIWLFANVLNNENNFNSKLNIYKIENDFLNIIPHKKNPVIVNYSNGRSAGNIFYNDKGELLRPSQNNSTKIYGGSLNISKILTLSIESYEEEVLKNIKPNFKLGLKGVHHYSSDNFDFLIDGLYSYKIL